MDPAPETDGTLRRLFPVVRHHGASWALRGVTFAKTEVALLATILVLCAGVWVFLSLAEEVHEGETAAIDRSLLLALRNPADVSDPIGPPWLEEVMRDITALGGHFTLSFITLAVIGFLLLSRKPGAAVLILAAVGGGMLLSTTLKMGFERPRPDLVPHGTRVFTASFPSGHATLSAVTYLTLGVLLAGLETRRGVKLYFLFLAVILTIMVGFSRVYLGVHWPTDVLAGWSIGAAWAMLVWLLALWLQRRGAVEQTGGAKPSDPG